MLDERRTAFTARLDGMSDPYGIAPEGKVSAWLLGERPSPVEWTGMGLIVAALALAVRAART